MTTHNARIELNSPPNFEVILLLSVFCLRTASHATLIDYRIREKRSRKLSDEMRSAALLAFYAFFGGNNRRDFVSQSVRPIKLGSRHESARLAR